MNFFKRLQKLSAQELKSLSGLCGGAALLIGVALVLSGSLQLPGLKLAFNANSQAAAVTTYNSGATCTQAAPCYWTAPAGVTQIYVTVVGAGGGSGGGMTSGDYGGGGGGGSGGYVSNQLVSVTPGQQYSIVIGKGGTGGAVTYSFNPPASQGGTGGSSSFNGNVIATGGAGGYAGSIAGNDGGAGGSPNGVTGQGNPWYSCPAASGGSNGTGYGNGGSYSAGCMQPGGAGQDGAVIINPSPILITATPSLVSPGGSSLVSWSATAVDPNSCTVTGPSGAIYQTPSPTVRDYTGQETYLNGSSNDYLASSADGTHAFLLNFSSFWGRDYFYTSSNSGASWAGSGFSGYIAPAGLTSSSDGTRLAAATNGGPIFTSTNYGGGWTQQNGAGSPYWQSIAGSTDGTKLAAIVGGYPGGYLYTSTDGGINWTARTNAGSHVWYALASSGDGNHIVAATYGGSSALIYVSNDGGNSWASYTPSGIPSGYTPFTLTSTSDGMHLAGVAQNQQVYLSDDGGVSWHSTSGAPNPAAYSVSYSADGSMLAVSGGGTGNGNGYYGLHVFTSRDHGQTWSALTNIGSSCFAFGGPIGCGDWSVAVSGNGNWVTAFDDSLGDIWSVFNDYGNISGNYNATNINSTQTYTISCKLNGNPVTSTATVYSGTPSVSLTASPTSGASGATSTLTWSSTLMQPGSCSIAASPASSGTGVNTPTTFTTDGATLPAGAPRGINQPLIIGKYVYRFGGYDGSAYTNVISRAPLSNPTSWSNTGANMPSNQVYSAEQFVVGNTIYSFGGFNGTAWGNSIYTASVSDPLTWSPSNPSTLPTAAPASYSTATVIGDTIYFYGGISPATGWTNAIYKAPISSPMSWTPAGTLPAGAPEGGPFGAVIVSNGYVYLLGGYTGSAPSKEIWRAPVSSPTSFVDTGATLPGILTYPGVAIINGTIYLLGGSTDTGTTWVGTIYSAPTSNPLAWSTVGTSLPATAGGGASGPVVINDKLYLFGGVSAATQNWTNTIFSAPVNTALPLTTYGSQPWFTDGGSNTAITWPLTQSTTYTLSCTTVLGAPISSSATVSVASPSSLTLTPAAQSVSQSATPNLAWTSSNVNAGSCSVVQGDPSGATSTLSAMGAGDNTNKNTASLTQTGTYNYTLACAAPYIAGNNGTLVGGPATTTGEFGQGLTLNGTQYTDVPMILNSSALTVSVWFKATSISSGNPRLVANSHTDTDHKGFQLQFNSGGGSGFFDVGNGTTVGVANWTQQLVAGQWYHYVGVYDGSHVYAYLNGVQVASAAYAGGAIAASGNDLNIGRNPASLTDYFNGTVDDVRIYSRALSPTEVSALTSGGQIVGGLTGYWSFDSAPNDNDILGTTVYDLAGGVATKTATIAVTAVPSASLTASSPVNSGSASTLNWSSGNINAGSCAVVQVDPNSIVSNVFGMGSNDNGPNKSGPTLSLGGSYTYKLACFAPYTSGTNGTLVGSPTTGVTGPSVTGGNFGQAVTFNGSSQYLSLPSGQPLSNDNTSNTVSVWFKTTGTGVLVSDNNAAPPTAATNYDPLLYVETNGILHGGGYIGSAPALASASAVNNGAWHLAVVTYDSVAHTQALYLDGVQVGASVSGTRSGVGSPNSWTVGAGWGGSPWPNITAGWSYFNGSLDDVRIYNRALSADEVSTLYNGGQIVSGLGGYWSFDTALNDNDISGTTVYDLAGGVISKSASVTVSAVTPPASVTFNPSNVRVRKGSPAALNWTVTGMVNGISCYLLPALAGQPASGLINGLWNGSTNPWTGTGNTAAITQSGAYTLTCGNGTASTSATASITLVPVFQEI